MRIIYLILALSLGGCATGQYQSNDDWGKASARAMGEVMKSVGKGMQDSQGRGSSSTECRAYEVAGRVYMDCQ